MVDFDRSIHTALLLVDDDTNQLELRALTLKMLGFTVLSAGDPMQVISMLGHAEHKVDIAILDYEMPDMNGCVLADHLRERYPDLRIILYSGALSIPEDRMGGVDVFVPKGNGIQSLLAHITALAGDGTPPGRQVLGREAYASCAGRHSS